MNCQSCGMPMEQPTDRGGGRPDNQHCRYCTDDQGNLLSREAVREKMVQFHLKTFNKDQAQAEADVEKHMSMQPAWRQPGGGSVSATPSPSMGKSPSPVKPGGLQPNLTPPVSRPAPQPKPVVPPAPSMTPPTAPKPMGGLAQKIAGSGQEAPKPLSSTPAAPKPAVPPVKPVSTPPSKPVGQPIGMPSAGAAPAKAESKMTFTPRPVASDGLPPKPSQQPIKVDLPSVKPPQASLVKEPAAPKPAVPPAKPVSTPPSKPVGQPIGMPSAGVVKSEPTGVTSKPATPSFTGQPVKPVIAGSTPPARPASPPPVTQPTPSSLPRMGGGTPPSGSGVDLKKPGQE